MLSGGADNCCQDFPDRLGVCHTFPACGRPQSRKRIGEGVLRCGRYSREVMPCWIANLTSPATSRISSFSIIRPR